MDSKEFDATAVRSETPTTVSFDLRPFGDRQVEAIDSYLRGIGMALQMNVFRHDKPIVVTCSSGAAIPSSVDTLLANLRHQGVAIEINLVGDSQKEEAVVDGQAVHAPETVFSDEHIIVRNVAFDPIDGSLQLSIDENHKNVGFYYINVTFNSGNATRIDYDGGNPRRDKHPIVHTG